MTSVRVALLVVAICGAAVNEAMSQPAERRDAGPADGPGAGPSFRVLPPYAQRELQLTPEQQKQIESLEADVQAKMQKILTPEQLKQWSERRSARGPRGDQPGQDRPNPPRRGQSDESRSDRAAGDRDSSDNEPRRPRQGRGPDDRRDGSPRGDQTTSPRRADRPLERVVKQLNLPPEQQVKVDDVLKAHHEKVRDLFRQAQADLLVRMKDVLTAEQFQQFTKALENGPPGTRRRERSEEGSRSERAVPQP